VRGPAHALRIALAQVPWPLPARPRDRDELTLARTLRAFRVVRARPGEIVARRDGLTLVFRALAPHRAAVLFRRGELDEAPVPLGDIRAALADPTVRDAIHVRTLDKWDALVATRMGATTRSVLSATADRADYALLVPENPKDAAPTPKPRVVRLGHKIAALRRAHARIPIAVDDDPTLRYGAMLLAANWRDLGVNVRIANSGAQGRFTRVASLGRRTIPIARSVDARFVSPRVLGWREDRRGVVDYARVRLR
jgi:hypothetical protein